MSRNRHDISASSNVQRKQWYKTWKVLPLIVIALLLWPIAIFLVPALAVAVIWKKSVWSLGTKCLVSALIALPVIGLTYATATVKVKTVTETRKEAISYRTVENKDRTLTKGTTIVTRAGKAGEKLVTYKVKYYGAFRESEEKIKEVILSRPVDKIVRVGTTLKISQSKNKPVKKEKIAPRKSSSVKKKASAIKNPPAKKEVDAKKNSPKKQTPSKEARKSSKKKLADYNMNDIKSLIAKKVGVEVTSVTTNPQNGYVAVTYKEGSIWDENAAVFGTLNKASDIMPLVFEIEGTKRVYVGMKTTFTDKYGNSDLQKAVAIEIVKREADKINWKNVNSPNRAGLIRLASYFYLHPAISQNINNADIEQAVSYQKGNPTE